MGGWVGWVQKRSLHVTSTYLFTASTSWSAWGDGVGWSAITYLSNAHGLDVHLIATSAYLFTASISGSAWRGAITSLQCTRIGRSLGIHFHLVAHCVHVLVNLEGVGWGSGGCSLHSFLGWDWGGWGGWGWVDPLPFTCSLHPCLGQHGGGGVVEVGCSEMQ